MKIVSLNTWGGRASLENLLQFLCSYSDVDIFCLQEVWGGGEETLRKFFSDENINEVEWDLLQKIKMTLPNYNAYFRCNFFDFYGLAVFLKKEIRVLEEGELFVYKEKGYFSKEELGDHSRNIQYIRIDTSKGPRTIINFHGLWDATGKGDTKNRILQSEKILQFVKTIQNPFVLCGDFNLLPDTQSIQIFEQYGLRNLIREYKINSTRTSFYTKSVKFADYAFVSEGIQVVNFLVLRDEVSDHSPLLLEFE